MKSFILVTLAVIAVTLQECDATLQCPNTERINSKWYKWVTWSGEMPSNAIPNEEPIFRVAHYSSVTVGKMYGDKIVYCFESAYYRHYGNRANGEVEVLTSNYPERFNWTKTNLHGIQYLIYEHLVVGGCIDSYPVLIGTYTEKGRERSYGAIEVKPGHRRFHYAVNLDKSTFFNVYSQPDFHVLTFDDSCL